MSMDKENKLVLATILEMMTRQALADTIGVHINTIDYWIKNGVPEARIPKLRAVLSKLGKTVELSCPYNRHIDCYDLPKKCETCGWNPEVAQKRKKLLIALIKNERLGDRRAKVTK